MRPNGREANAIRDLKITRNFTKHAEGSVLIEVGDTRVLCNASVDSNVPRFLKGKGVGWITAEYSMLPRATHERTQREAARGKQTGRTQEIQRLIGRSLRSVVDLKLLGENTIHIDCDVLQADGGTRTAAITGGCVALIDALLWMKKSHIISTLPVRQMVGAVSVGVCNGKPVLDLEYEEDCQADTDMNVVMTDKGTFIEVQGTAENAPFDRATLNEMLELAESGINELFELQKQALEA